MFREFLRRWLGVSDPPAPNIPQASAGYLNPVTELNRALSLEVREQPKPVDENIWNAIDKRGHEMANELFEYGDAVVILVSVNNREGNNAQTRMLKWSRGNVHAQEGMCDLFKFERNVEGVGNLIRAIAQTPPPQPPPGPDLGNAPI